MATDIAAQLYNLLKENVESFNDSVQEAKVFRKPLSDCRSAAANLIEAFQSGVDSNFKRRHSLIELAVKANDVDSF